MKNLSPAQMREAGADIILSNTYHLMIQPGPETVEHFGGLHSFMGWDGPMLTDSGGYQVFSMQHGGIAEEIKGRQAVARRKTLRKITEEGALFTSYRTGEHLFVSPESSIAAQRQLGADLIVSFDELTAFHDTREYTARSLERTHRWGGRCLAEFERGHSGKQGLYAVVQGGVYEDLRLAASDWTASNPFFGTAIGGCLGDTKEKLYEIVSWCTPRIHPKRPVHLLGIGDIIDVFEGVKLGIDTFDCVSPARIARHGSALLKGVPGGKINLRNAQYAYDKNPLWEDQALRASNGFSRGYIHHLLKSGELLASQILTQHNVGVMTRLMREIRQAIADGTLDALQKEWIPDEESARATVCGG